MSRHIELPDTALFTIELSELPSLKEDMRRKGLAFRILERRAKTATLEVSGLKAGRAVASFSKTARREDRVAARA